MNRIEEEGVAGGSRAALAERLSGPPWKLGFLSLMRHFGAAFPAQPAIGLARHPRQEPFRLGQVASLAFAPREIAEVANPLALPAAGATRRRGNRPDRPAIRLFGLGLLGPHGPLPLHYTELVRERTEHHGDHTLADFLDLFHHRWLTHFHRAWAQGQAAAGLDRAGDETFSRYVARLIGHDPLEIHDSPLPAHARLAASPHLRTDARHPDGLAATLAHFFAVPVRLHEFVLHWFRLDDEDRTCLGRPGVSSQLGQGAIAGDAVADRQGKFRLVIGPLGLEAYLRFTPRGRDLPVLVEWVRAFVGHEFVWDTELRVRRDDMPPARLGGGERLGWSTWLGGTAPGVAGQIDPATDHAVGMVFEPERYLATQERTLP